MHFPRWPVVLAMVLLAAAAQAADDIVIADFEGPGYGAWKAEGDAFGQSPAKGTLPNQQKVSGFQGAGLVNTYFNGDKTTGTLTSPAFRIERQFINFLIGGGAHEGQTCINLLVDGKPVRSATGNENEKLEWATWDVPDLAGKTATIQIIDKHTGGWGHINIDQIVQSDDAKGDIRRPVIINTDLLYKETYRPQFHFTAQKNWLNDPNGLVFYKGEYHLFFQYNPFGREWGNMTWGHAVSKDLIHWEQLPHALEQDELGDIFSGSAVVDWNNTAGFGTEALVLIYTYAGGISPKSKTQPFTQAIAYSNDGRTFKKYSGNPVIKKIGPGTRDPKVIWHKPTNRWVMALYVDLPHPTRRTSDGQQDILHTIQFFSSPDLKEWKFESQIDGFFECPDIFELPVQGEPGKSKWVLFAADGEYVVGDFDGKTFKPDGEKKPSDWGANYYAAQTYSDVPDGRRIIIGWMRGGKYPGMPFNQQMSFPCELSLRASPQGPILCKWPVKEIERLVINTTPVSTPLKPGQPIPLLQSNIPAPGSELYDITAEFDVADVQAVTFDIRGAQVKWTADNKLTALKKSAPLAPIDGKVKLRILVDRTSLEVFGNGGAVTLSSCFLAHPDNFNAIVSAEGGEVKQMRASTAQLRSAWKKEK